MITKQQILQATGDELSRLAGEVLGQKGTHKLDYPAYGQLRRCVLCGAYEESASFPGGCKNNVAPIPLTWPEAMKWRDWSVEKFGVKQFKQAMYSVCLMDKEFYLSDIAFSDWLASKVAPEHYIKAACICVFEGRSGKSG